MGATAAWSSRHFPFDALRILPAPEIPQGQSCARTAPIGTAPILYPRRYTGIIIPVGCKGPSLDPLTVGTVLEGRYQRPMNTQAAKLFADYVEPHLEVLSQCMLEAAPPKNRDTVRALVLPWLQELVGMLRGQSFRVREWSANLSEALAANGGTLLDLMEVGRSARDVVLLFCSGKVPGLSDLDLAGTVNEIYDIHVLQAAQYFTQRDRDANQSMSRRQRSIMDTVGRPFMLIDGNGMVIEANEACSQQLNTPMEALSGRDFLVLCDEETVQEMRRLLRQRRPTVKKHEFTGRLAACPDREVLFLVQPMFDSDGRRDGAAVCFEPANIERVGVDDVLEYVRRRFIDIVPFPVQLLDENGLVVHATELARDFTFADNVEPLPYCCHFHRRLGTAGTCACRQVFRTGAPHFDEVRLDEPDQARWFSLGILPIFAPDGRVTHVACGLVDQTAQKRLEKRMENQILAHQRSSLVSQIALTVAQRLRDPLGVIIGFAELMSKGVPREQLPEMITRILRNSLRCKEIVDDLLDFGQGTPLERVPADICAVLRESVRPMLTNAQNRRVEWRLPNEPAWVECVPAQLAQVIMGVLDNALCFAKSKVICEIGSDAGRAWISVADDGNGIPGELDEQVFEPFFTTRRAEGAVGLGLSLARSVVRDCGGDLFLTHEGEPELPGAHLVIQLPAIAGAPSAGESSSAEDTTDGHPLQILLVDDEPELLDMLCTALSMRGYEADSVQTGADALDRIRTADYDGVVLDIRLLGAMNGRELYLRIAAEKPELAKRILFITADTLNFETQRFLETVNCPSLEKPFLISNFLEAMELLAKKPFRAQHSPLNA